MTTFVGKSKHLGRACAIGLFRGLGHTIALSIVGILVIGMKIPISKWLADRMELIVAVMLVILGARLIATVHTRWHQHHHDVQWLRLGLRPLLVGVVHGTGGSAALTLLVLSTISSTSERAALHRRFWSWKHAWNAGDQRRVVVSASVRGRTLDHPHSSFASQHRRADLRIRHLYRHRHLAQSVIGRRDGKGEKSRRIGKADATEIFQSAVEHARDEIQRPWTALSFSGIAGGLNDGIDGLVDGLVISLLGHGSIAQMVAAVVYPIGFLAVIVGRAQLFTENTLYPVVLILTEKGYLI